MGLILANQQRHHGETPLVMPTVMDTPPILTGNQRSQANQQQLPAQPNGPLNVRFGAEANTVEGPLPLPKLI